MTEALNIGRIFIESFVSARRQIKLSYKIIIFPVFWTVFFKHWYMLQYSFHFMY